MSPMHAKMPHWLSRLLSARPTQVSAAWPLFLPPSGGGRPGSASVRSQSDYAASSSLQSRIEICPPELWPSSLSWRGRLTRWLNNSRWLPAPARPMNRLALVKAEFRQAVLDVAPGLLDGLDERIERARSLREFWHLRSPLYSAVSMGLNQLEAERRLSALNRHFPRRTPRCTPRHTGATAVVSHVAPAINAATLAVIESAAARRAAPLNCPPPAIPPGHPQHRPTALV